MPRINIKDELERIKKQSLLEMEVKVALMQCLGNTTEIRDFILHATLSKEGLYIKTTTGYYRIDVTRVDGRTKEVSELKE